MTVDLNMNIRVLNEKVNRFSNFSNENMHFFHTQLLSFLIMEPFSKVAFECTTLRVCITARNGQPGLNNVPLFSYHMVKILASVMIKDASAH